MYIYVLPTVSLELVIISVPDEWYQHLTNEFDHLDIWSQ